MKQKLRVCNQGGPGVGIHSWDKYL